MKTLCFAATVLVFLVSSLDARAYEGDFGFGIKAGTLGGGVEVESGVFDDVYFRLGASYLPFSINASSAVVDYSMDAEFKNGSFLVDWHPFSGVFRCTLGVFISATEISVTGTPRVGSFPAQYASFAPLAQDEKLVGTVEFNDFPFYAGLGWSSNTGQKGWGVSLDVGALFQGPASVKSLALSHADRLDNYPEAQDAYDSFVASEKDYIEDDLSGYEIYPVVSLIASYNF